MRVLDYINKMKEKTKKKNEEFGAPPGMLPSPSRKGVKKAKDTNAQQIEILADLIKDFISEMNYNNIVLNNHYEINIHYYNKNFH